MFGAVLIGGSLAGCAPRAKPEAIQAEAASASLALVGAELEYVFESGRRYRARYADQTVHFELLEPVVPNPPSHTLRYRAKTIREGVYLVAWEGFDYQPVFVIDLVERKVHTRAVREEGDVLFMTATVVSLSYPKREP